MQNVWQTFCELCSWTLIVSELSKEPLDIKDTIEKSANYEFIVSKHDYKAASSNLYIVGQSYVDGPTNPLDVTPVSDDEREDLEINGTLLLGQVRSCLLLSINCVPNKYNPSSLDQLNHPMIDHYNVQYVWKKEPFYE